MKMCKRISIVLMVMTILTTLLCVPVAANDSQSDIPTLPQSLQQTVLDAAQPKDSTPLGAAIGIGLSAVLVVALVVFILLKKRK